MSTAPAASSGRSASTARGGLAAPMRSRRGRLGANPLSPARGVTRVAGSSRLGVDRARPRLRRRCRGRRTRKTGNRWPRLAEGVPHHVLREERAYRWSCFQFRFPMGAPAVPEAAAIQLLVHRAARTRPSRRGAGGPSRTPPVQFAPRHAGLLVLTSAADHRHVGRASGFATTPSSCCSVTTAHNASPSSNAGTVAHHEPAKSSASRIARRSAYGCSSVETPSIASRSNARKQTGMAGRA